MGKKRSIEHNHHRARAPKSQTLPPSPSHSFSSSSSSDFEFTISLSPRNKSSLSLCPADELFYKGQLLPLHLSPRLSMVRTLLLASSSTSSGSSASRDSTGRSSTDSHSSFNSELVLLAESCDSSRRPSSVAAEDHDNNNNNQIKASNSSSNSRSGNNFRYFSLQRFSSVFKREPNSKRPESGCGNAAPAASSSVKRMSSTAKEVIRKYLKKVKPLYEKISQKQSQQNQNNHQQVTTQKLGRLMMVPVPESTATRSIKPVKKSVNGFSNSFSGNLRYPRRKSSISSCPSSIRSSPSHSGVLCRPGFGNSAGKGMFQNNNISLEKTTSSSMEELQSAIQGAIAHCKNSHRLSHGSTMTKESTVLVIDEI